jgi:hypothetical protein
MRYLLTLITLIIWTGLKGQVIQEIELQFNHSLRIPFNEVILKATHYNDKCILLVKVKPMNDDSNWTHTKVDTSYVINKDEFNKLKTMVSELQSTDIIKAMTGGGTDGTLWILTFGDFQNNISYQVWTLDYKTKERGLLKYRAVCEYMLTLGQINFKKLVD